MALTTKLDHVFFSRVQFSQIYRVKKKILREHVDACMTRRVVDRTSDNQKEKKD